ncbi:MAG: FAD-dependent oxidoreductase, partial [Methyloligellaceae bacterium]
MKWQRTVRLGPDHGLPVVADVDAIIVGGGAAGVSAAETIGRKGYSALLVARYGFCGGNAVAGMSGTICGMYLSSERVTNRPEQAVFGFTERFRVAILEAGGITDPQRYGRTWTVCHDPLRWREVAD